MMDEEMNKVNVRDLLLVHLYNSFSLFSTQRSPLIAHSEAGLHLTPFRQTEMKPALVIRGSA